MFLNVLERVVLRGIIPQIQGWNFANMKEARELTEGLFTEQEESELSITQDNERLHWNLVREDGSAIPQEREFEVSEGLKAKVKIFLAKLDREEKLGLEHFTLCGKFGM